nr:YhdH/YhfP family quinone oxidoreductase [uncultured Desulfobulbus sp.]
MSRTTFPAFVVSEGNSGQVYREIKQKTLDELPPGEVLIQVEYSSLNYKDALSANGNRGVSKHYPHTPGIDAAGIVVESSVSGWQPGDEVICSGYDLGMDTDGGFARYIRVPQSWVVRKPQNLSLLESMQLGTAGFTAALSVLGLESNGVTPQKGPVLVTGATGGVGTVALQILVSLGYTVVSVSGKSEAKDFLQGLGAAEVIDRESFLAKKDKGLLTATWAGVVDTVGGDILATAIKGTNYDGVVTSCGNAASADLPLNVYPFILRGVHLLGIYAANCAMEKRLLVWEKLSAEWKLKRLDTFCRLIGLGDLDTEITRMLAGKSKGRCVVQLGE